MDMSDEAVEVLGELIGADRAAEFASGGHDFERRLREAVVETGYGHVWSSPILSRRERALITVAVLAATGRASELKLHTGIAVEQGVDAESLAEAFLQVSLYAGFPAALDATAVLRKIVEARS